LRSRLGAAAFVSSASDSSSEIVCFGLYLNDAGLLVQVSHARRKIESCVDAFAEADGVHYVSALESVLQKYHQQYHPPTEHSLKAFALDFSESFFHSSFAFAAAVFLVVACYSYRKIASDADGLDETVGDHDQLFAGEQVSSKSYQRTDRLRVDSVPLYDKFLFLALFLWISNFIFGIYNRIECWIVQFFEMPVIRR
jgi:hypothetical protein